MATELPLEKRSAYSAIIDSILSSADLETISAKAIRRGLQEQVHDDLASEKQAITDLIMERFDKVQRERANPTSKETTKPPPATNGTAHAVKREPKVKYEDIAETVEQDDQPSPAPSNKRKAEEDEDDDELSDVKDTPPPKKAKKAPIKPEAESDEQMAKRLQAEFTAGTGRSTRGGGASAKKSKPTAKREKKPKKKSAAKINSDDDSGVENTSTFPKPEREKKGGFHKLMNLSEPLQALLGESQLSRPQTVKRIWAYVKERDLQDPSDKRQIRCDDLMRGVFKAEKVHMFTMNKVLAGQLWPVEEA